MYSDGSTSTLAGVHWYTSSGRFVRINSNGLARTRWWRTGSVTVYASLNGIVGSTVMTVTTSKLASVSITPASATIAQGTMLKFALTGTYANGTTVNLTPQSAYWSSSNWH